jgi:hypothetical protein
VLCGDLAAFQITCRDRASRPRNAFLSPFAEQGVNPGCRRNLRCGVGLSLGPGALEASAGLHGPAFTTDRPQARPDFFRRRVMATEEQIDNTPIFYGRSAGKPEGRANEFWTRRVEVEMRINRSPF